MKTRDEALAALLFLVAGLVWLGSSAHYHGDERYYTDAALKMLASGDLWTPQWPDGTLRSNKPLLTYWTLMGSFALGGVSFFVARLPFLVAGALLVWLTARLTRVLFPTERAAPLIAALVVASDYEVVALARRTTPDILLMLFTAVSLYGLARIVVARERSLAAAACFWLGGALAIATKGGLGLAVLVFGTVILVTQRKHTPLRALFPVPLLVAAAGIAFVGLVPSVLRDESPGALSFVNDQVGARIAGSAGEVAGQLVDYATSLAKHFLPWIVFVAIGAFAAREAFLARWREHKTAIVLALGWAALLWILFSFSNTHRGRYLAPAHAILAAALAPFLLEVARTRWGRRTAWTFAVLVVVCTTAGAVLVARVDVVTGCVWLAPLALFLVGTRIVRDEAAALRALALALLAVMTLVQESLIALVRPSVLPVVVEQIEALAPKPAHLATLGFPSSTAGVVRVLSEGRVDPVHFTDDVPDETLARCDLVIASEAAFGRLERRGFRIERVTRTPLDVDLEKGRALFLRGEPLAQTLFVGPWIGLARPSELPR